MFHHAWINFNALLMGETERADDGAVRADGKAHEGFHAELPEDGSGNFPATCGFRFDERFAGVRHATRKRDVHRDFKRLRQSGEINAVHAAVDHYRAIEIAQLNGDHREPGHLAGFAGDGVEQRLLPGVGEHDFRDALKGGELAIAP